MSVCTGLLAHDTLPVPGVCISACGWFVSGGNFTSAAVWGLEPLHCQVPLALIEPDRSGKQDLYFTMCLTFLSCAGREVADSSLRVRAEEYFLAEKVELLAGS